MQKSGKLELTWVGKYEKKLPEPRVLVEDISKSYGNVNSKNILIQGDNLIALQALQQDFAGKIKCIYIDPPYNTGSAFEQYDDSVQHSIWLNLMRDRLQLLWNLLCDDNGVLLISINDDECHYLKVLCDELFGRDKFIVSLVWNYEGNTDNQAKIINYHEYILVYSKSGVIDNPKVIDPNVTQDSKLYKDEIRNTIIKNGRKNPPKTVIIPEGFPCSFENGVIYKKDVTFPQYSDDIIVEGWVTTNAVKATTGWSSKALLEEFIEQGYSAVIDTKGQKTLFELKPTGAIEAVKRRESQKGHFVSVLRGFGTTNQMRLMLEKMGVKFSYPKPVKLIEYLIEAFTGEEDYVLDSFAGSGTTAHAVMHLNYLNQTNRRFILVELSNDTMQNIILPRLRFVVDGCPAADVPACGDGFKYYNLAESLFVKHPVLPIMSINPSYTFEMMCEAICKIEGFKYAPDGVYHGHSSEKRFIYITKEFVNAEYIQSITTTLGEDQSLLIYGTKIQSDMILPDNIEVKRIPKDLLEKCDFESEAR